MLLKKRIFFSFFFTSEQLVSHPTLDFSHLDTSIHPNKKKTIDNNDYDDDCFTMM